MRRAVARIDAFHQSAESLASFCPERRKSEHEWAPHARWRSGSRRGSGKALAARFSTASNPVVTANLAKFVDQALDARLLDAQPLSTGQDGDVYRLRRASLLQRQCFLGGFFRTVN